MSIFNNEPTVNTDMVLVIDNGPATRERLRKVLDSVIDAKQPIIYVQHVPMLGLYVELANQSTVNPDGTETGYELYYSIDSDPPMARLTRRGPRTTPVPEKAPAVNLSEVQDAMDGEQPKPKTAQELVDEWEKQNPTGEGQ